MLKFESGVGQITIWENVGGARGAQLLTTKIPLTPGPLVVVVKDAWPPSKATNIEPIAASFVPPTSGSAVRLFNLAQDVKSAGLKGGSDSTVLVDKVLYSLGSKWAPVPIGAQSYTVFSDGGAGTRLASSPFTAPIAPMVFTLFLLGSANFGYTLAPQLDAPEKGPCRPAVRQLHHRQIAAATTVGSPMQCADLASSEQTISSYFGVEHYLAFDSTQLGIPALGFRMYSDRNLDLHHGEGLWLQLLQVSVGRQNSPIGRRHDKAVKLKSSTYMWRPDFVEQTGELVSTTGATVAMMQQTVYYTSKDTIEADLVVQALYEPSTTTLLLTGRPNPANTFVTIHELGWNKDRRALQIGVVLKTNLTHGAGGTAAGCIAAGICEPLTMRAVVSVSLAGCAGAGDGAGCGNLSVSFVCWSPPPPPAGAQCELTKQSSHLLCVKNKTFGCYANNTMWTSDVNGARCMGIFSCAGVSGVDCPGTGTLIGQRTHCRCLSPPPQRSCNYTFSFALPANNKPAHLHAAVEFVNESVFSSRLLSKDGAAVQQQSNTTKIINAWLAEAAPLQAGTDLDERERTMYYRSWLNYWQMVSIGQGNWSGQPVISSSKTSCESAVKPLSAGTEPSCCLV